MACRSPGSASSDAASRRLRPPQRERDGFVVDVQADLLSHLATRMVAPLLPERSAPRPIGDLNPVVDIGGERHVLLTQALASVPRRELGPVLGQLAAERDAITRALNTLFVGF